MARPRSPTVTSMSTTPAARRPTSLCPSSVKWPSSSMSPRTATRRPPLSGVQIGQQIERGDGAGRAGVVGVVDDGTAVDAGNRPPAAAAPGMLCSPAMISSQLQPLDQTHRRQRAGPYGRCGGPAAAPARAAIRSGWHPVTAGGETEANAVHAGALDLVRPEIGLWSSGRNGRSRGAVISAMARTRSSSQLRMAMPPSSAAGSAWISSRFGLGDALDGAQPAQVAWADVGHRRRPVAGPDVQSVANLARRHTCPFPAQPARGPCSRLSSVSGRPCSLFRLPGLASVAIALAAAPPRSVLWCSSCPRCR